MLSLIYSEILKMLRLWGFLDFDVEIFFPHDRHSLPRGYHKQKSKESDNAHILTSQGLLVEVTYLIMQTSFFWVIICIIVCHCVGHAQTPSSLMSVIFDVVLPVVN